MFFHEPTRCTFPKADAESKDGLIRLPHTFAARTQPGQAFGLQRTCLGDAIAHGDAIADTCAEMPLQVQILFQTQIITNFTHLLEN